MRKADVRVGGRYTAKVSGKIVTVRITNEHHNGSVYKGWDAINETSQRAIVIKTAARLRETVSVPT